jgi:hypothetical protein
MEAHGVDCCQRSGKRGWAASAVMFTALAALTPKCPMCIAAWLGVLGLSGLAARVDQRVLWLATAFAVAACMPFVIHRLITSKESDHEARDRNT